MALALAAAAAGCTASTSPSSLDSAATAVERGAEGRLMEMGAPATVEVELTPAGSGGVGYVAAVDVTFDAEARGKELVDAASAVRSMLLDEVGKEGPKGVVLESLHLLQSDGQGEGVSALVRHHSRAGRRC